MEYVDGISITQFCDQHELTLRARLVLFTQVCAAVQFAHQNLVVHRDLKPDNILVFADGTPRLLDFGTAKLLVPLASDPAAGFTQQGLQAFTPQYASPEQVLGNPITTASDIYSLGVLLYLLLAGVPPYKLKEFTTAEMLRLICTESPPKPSTTSPPSQPLDADLDAIVLKALRKQPPERYATVDQFAADIQRWLDGLPVLARRGDWRYRSGKFMRRHKLPLLAAALLLVTILSGIAGILWQSRIANLERRRAEARSDDLRQLSNSLLSELDEALKDIPGSTGAQKLLVTRVTEHLDRMAADAHGDRQTTLDLAEAYTRLGNVQGNVYDQNLADATGALASFNKALALVEPLAASNPRDQDALRALAAATENRGEVLSEFGTAEDSVASLTAAVQTYDRLIELPGATPDLLLEASTANQTLGDELGQDTGLADIAGCLRSYRKSLALDERALQLHPGYLRARRGIALMHLHIGNAELDDDAPDALDEFRVALQLEQALPADERAKLNQVRMRALLVRKQAAAMTELGEYSSAIPLFDQSVQAFERLAETDVKNIRSLGDLKRVVDDEATCFEDAADPILAERPGNRRQYLAAAAQLLEQEASIIREIIKQDPTHKDLQLELAGVLVRLGTARQELRQPGNVEPNSRHNLAVIKSFAVIQQPSPRNLDLAASSFLSAEPASLRDAKLAAAYAQRGVDLTHRKSTSFFLELAQALRADGQPGNAIAAANEGLALLPPPRPGAPIVRIRKLLELESRADFSPINRPSSLSLKPATPSK
jgi:tetratricopeptide (TPR) repeat protein